MSYALVEKGTDEIIAVDPTEEGIENLRKFYAARGVFDYEEMEVIKADDQGENDDH